MSSTSGALQPSLFYSDLRAQNISDKAEREETLGKILKKPEFNQFISTIFNLKRLVDIFPESASEPFQKKVFKKLSQVTNNENSTNENCYGFFTHLFRKFIDSAKSPEERKLVCTNLLGHLPRETHAFQYLNKPYSLATFILEFPDLTDHMMKLECFDVEKEALLKEIGLRKEETERQENQKVQEEERRKQEAQRVREAQEAHLQKIKSRLDNSYPKKIIGANLHNARTRAEALALLRANAGILEVRNELGQTPLMCATSNGRKEVTLLLLSFGAKVAVEDINGYTPKEFRLFYDCDHEYDPGACIPLKKYMDKDIRDFLAKIEALETKYLSAEIPLYSLEEIKDDLLDIVSELIKTRDCYKPLVALYGYISHHLNPSEREGLDDLFWTSQSVANFYSYLKEQNIDDLSERERVLGKILDNPNFSKFTSSISDLKSLVETFPESTSADFRDKVFAKLSQVKKDELPNYLNPFNNFNHFKILFDKFVNSAASDEDRALVCTNVLGSLPRHTQAFQHLNKLQGLSSFIIEYPTLQDHIAGLECFNVEKEALLKEIDLQKEKKEHQESQKIEQSVQAQATQRTWEAQNAYYMDLILGRSSRIDPE